MCCSVLLPWQWVTSELWTTLSHLSNQKPQCSGTQVRINHTWLKRSRTVSHQNHRNVFVGIAVRRTCRWVDQVNKKEPDNILHFLSINKSHLKKKANTNIWCSIYVAAGRCVKGPVQTALPFIHASIFKFYFESTGLFTSVSAVVCDDDVKQVKAV